MADTSGLAAGSQATMKLENTEKRDTLIEIEKRYQKKWAEDHVFEVDAPTLKEIPASVSIDEIHEKFPKTFLTMAYPV
jgi:leucyl-tRNA synthetase